MMVLRGHSSAIAAALLMFLSHSTHAFINPCTSTSVTCPQVAKSSSTQLHLFDIFNEGKKKLVKKLAGDYDEEAVRARLDGLINGSPVLMLSFTTCPFCVKAKEVLDAKGAKYTVVELDKDEDGKAIRAEMGDIVGRTSVPAIWIDKVFVGGCNDGPMGGLVKLDETGELNGMLQAVGAM